MATSPGVEGFEESSSGDQTFLWLSMGAWVKIMLGWLTASLIGIAGWFLYVRDSIADRPTIEVVDEKIQRASQESIHALLKHGAIIDRHSSEINSLQIGASAFIEIHRAQTQSLSDQSDQLKAIQADIKKILFQARQ